MAIEDAPSQPEFIRRMMALVHLMREAIRRVVSASVKKTDGKMTK